MRNKAVEYGRSLGVMLRIPKWELLLPEPPAVDEKKLTSQTDEALERWDEQLVPVLPGAHSAVGWRVFVELASRISRQPLAENAGSIREALTLLHLLFEHVRSELKQSSPTPPTAGGGETVEQLALDILNRHIRPFLA